MHSRVVMRGNRGRPDVHLYLPCDVPREASVGKTG